MENQRQRVVLPSASINRPLFAHRRASPVLIQYVIDSWEGYAQRVAVAAQGFGLVAVRLWQQSLRYGSRLQNSIAVCCGITFHIGSLRRLLAFAHPLDSCSTSALAITLVALASTCMICISPHLDHHFEARE